MKSKLRSTKTKAILISIGWAAITAVYYVIEIHHTLTV